jgi:hypothetical protein
VSFLLDVNVLLAVCWEEMETHETARSWFSAHVGEGWATCTLTESAFVRLSMNPKVFPDPASFREALAVLEALRKVPGYRFLVQSAPFTEADFPAKSVRGYRQVVDASLLALSRKHEVRLVSFDKGLVQLAASGGWDSSLQLL